MLFLLHLKFINIFIFKKIKYNKNIERVSFTLTTKVLTNWTDLQVNGTGRIISSDVVSGKRPFESSQQHQRKVLEGEEYERFARSRTSKDSSTPNREEKWRSREIERQTKDSSRDRGKSGSNARPKNFSTVSLPNYDELDVARHRPEENDEHEQRRDKTRKAGRPVRSSTGSLPAESFLSPFSEVHAATVRIFRDRLSFSDNAAFPGQNRVLRV